MKVFQLHVGNQLPEPVTVEKDKLLERWSFDDDAMRWYLKQDIINQDTQMQSLIAAGVEITYGHFSFRKSISSLLRGGKKLRAICREKGIDVVHAYWGTTTSLMAVLFSPVPVVISFSGSEIIGSVTSDGKIARDAFVSLPLSWLSAILASHIITKSAHMKSRLPAIVHAKTTVIPNGVDLSGFYPVSRDKALQKTGWDPAKKHIIFFNGTGNVVKNQPLAEQVFGRIRASVPDAEFHILKTVAHHELLYYYNAADLMILTSFHEGSNNSTKEAMACNTPIVSTDCGDARERLEGVTNSYVANSYSAEELSEASIRILRTNERSDAVKKIGELSAPSIAKKVIEVYNKVVRK
jgi:teichuronic acid biosynthesis glycosyltransferase TuaC